MDTFFQVVVLLYPFSAFFDSSLSLLNKILMVFVGELIFLITLNIFDIPIKPIFKIIPLIFYVFLLIRIRKNKIYRL